MEITPNAGVWIEVPKALAVIKDAGYPPVGSDVRLTISGTIRKRGEQYVLELDGMQKPLSLPLSFAKGDDKTLSLVAARTDNPIMLQGFWQSDAKAVTGVLRVSSVEEVNKSEREKPR